MKLELTAVYEQQADGSVGACVAELPQIKVRGKNRDEARANLTEQLRRTLENKRDRVLSRIASDAPTETITIELPLPSASGKRHRLKRKEGAWSKSEMIFWRRLLDAGLIDTIPPVPVDPDAIDPIPVQGRPLSEEIIEDRR